MREHISSAPTERAKHRGRGARRSERKFPNFDELIAAIRSDIATADQSLKLPEYAACAELPRFRECLTVPAGNIDDDDDGFSFMAPPEGYECEDEEECVLPDDDDDE